MNRKSFIKWIGIILLCAVVIYGGVMWGKSFQENKHEGQVQNEGNEQFSKLIEAYDLIQNGYIETVGNEQLIDGAIEGMVATLEDPNSIYMDAEMAEDFSERLDTSFEGIGAQITVEDGKLIIISPIKNTPAEKAGLQARDEIISIDGEKVEGLNLHEASLKLRGEKGSVVKLELIRSGQKEPIQVSMIRDEVPLLTVFSDVKEKKSKKIGYLEITSFARGTAKEFQTELNKLEEQKIEGLVIDVRGNPGGMLTSVEEILEMLVTDKKPYVQIEEREGKRTTRVSPNVDRKPYPISVLIDEGSASASEILAAALQEIEEYPLVGVTSFGKGTVQQTLPLEDNSQIKLTMFKWLTPNGNWIHEKGVKPTIEVKQPNYFYTHRLQVIEPIYKDMNSEKVMLAQQLLKGLGFSPERLDGYFDERTELAVKTFQTIQDLPNTGVIDELTAEKLTEEINKQKEKEANDLQLQMAIEVLFKK